MTKVWKITAYEEHMGGGPPQKHYYLVAMSDQSAALSALRKRPSVRDADLTVVGEATSLSQTQTPGGVYSGVSIMLGSHLVLDTLAEWIEW